MIAGSVVDYRRHIDLCIIRLADCALVLVLRPVLEERWRAGGACLRPNVVVMWLEVLKLTPVNLDTGFLQCGK